MINCGTNKIYTVDCNLTVIMVELRITIFLGVFKCVVGVLKIKSLHEGISLCGLWATILALSHGRGVEYC